MSTTSEKNQFRRLIGDYGKNAVIDSEVESYLDDATYELTADFTDSTGAPVPITDFDVLVVEYHPEVVYKAAINYWWQKAATLADKHTQTVGQASANTSEKWTRAIEMIKELEERYAEIQTLGIDITMGNLSVFSKATLARNGGQSEEAFLDAAEQ